VTAGAGAPAASPARRHLDELLPAFNGGDGGLLETFARERLAEAAFPPTVEERAAQLARYAAETGGFDAAVVAERTRSTVDALGRARLTGEWYRLRVRTADAPPHPLLQVVFDPALAPPEERSGAVSPEQAADRVRRLLATLVGADQFSGAVLMTRGDETLLAEAHGLANAAFGAPNRVDTRFNVASMGKMVTAVAVAQLVARGAIAFEDAVIRYLPEYPAEVAAHVTLHHLLTHTSGVGDFFGPAFFGAAKDRFRTVDDLLPLVRDAAPVFTPGERWGYSNGGYVLLGAVIERVANRGYAEYVREHVYRPAGMSRTDAVALDEIEPNLAEGYTHSAVRHTPSGVAFGVGAGRRRSNRYMLPVTGGPAGGSYSTVGDLGRFAAALRDHRLLPPALGAAVLAGKVATDGVPSADGSAYAYGFFDQSVGGQRVVGHNGGAPGISGQLDMYPGADLTVAVLANYDPPAAQRVAVFVRGLIGGQEGAAGSTGTGAGAHGGRAIRSGRSGGGAARRAE
jgi:D-alanyl-D-alanine carboxypeptidase